MMGMSQVTGSLFLIAVKDVMLRPSRRWLFSMCIASNGN
jgi:hypothetical protein